MSASPYAAQDYIHVVNCINLVPLLQYGTYPGKSSIPNSQMLG